MRRFIEFKNKKVSKSDNWSEIFEFYGYLRLPGMTSPVPVTGTGERFLQKSSVVDPGDIWVLSCEFRPRSGAAIVRAQKILTDRPWGSGIWQFYGPARALDQVKAVLGPYDHGTVEFVVR